MASASLISPENTWALWAILTGIAALSIWLEQNYKWASKVTGAIIPLIASCKLTYISLQGQNITLNGIIIRYNELIN